MALYTSGTAERQEVHTSSTALCGSDSEGQKALEAATDHRVGTVSGCASDDSGELIHITLRDAYEKTS